MARYTGAKTKKSRRLGVMLIGSEKSFERKNYPPGVHGPRSARRKQSDYALAMAEKQKLRYQYGLLERQFRKYYEEARRRRGVTGETMLQLLECRLDNVVFRMGLAKTRDGARQMVGDGHVQVNGRKVDIPSFQVGPGDKITVRDSTRSQSLARKNLERTQITQPPVWMTFDRDQMVGEMNYVPSRDEIQPVVNEQLIVELYSR